MPCERLEVVHPVVAMMRAGSKCVEASAATKSRQVGWANRLQRARFLQWCSCRPKPGTAQYLVLCRFRLLLREVPPRAGKVSVHKVRADWRNLRQVCRPDRTPWASTAKKGAAESCCKEAHWRQSDWSRSTSAVVAKAHPSKLRRDGRSEKKAIPAKEVASTTPKLFMGTMAERDSGMCS